MNKSIATSTKETQRIIFFEVKDERAILPIMIEYRTSTKLTVRKIVYVATVTHCVLSKQRHKKIGI